MSRTVSVVLFFFLTGLILNAQSPLNRLDTFYFNGEKQKAIDYAESLLNSTSLSDSGKKAVAAYMEIKRILGNDTLSDGKKRDCLDVALPLATEAVNTNPVCADAYYARGLNRMFAANLVREFSSLNNITSARDDFVNAFNLDNSHYGCLSELAGIYGYMPELITFGDRNIAVNLSKKLYSIRGTRRDACQLAALLLRRNWSPKKRNGMKEKAKTAFEKSASSFDAAASFEGSEEADKFFRSDDSDRNEAENLCRTFNLSLEEITGERAWSRIH